MDDLLAEFVAETREMLAALSGEIVAWEADPTERARLDTIFRFVHTVKGNCGFFDVPRLEALSHAAEDALSATSRDSEDWLMARLESDAHSCDWMAEAWAGVVSATMPPWAVAADVAGIDGLVIAGL